jgi:hypothetical protein
VEEDPDASVGLHDADVTRVMGSLGLTAALHPGFVRLTQEVTHYQ